MRTKQVLKTVLLSEMTLSLFGFVTCLQNHISLSDECDTPLSTSECFWLRLNRQSFYHYRKRQLVPTDRYRFRSIGKLIGSVSHDRVAYRYLDAFPKINYQSEENGTKRFVTVNPRNVMIKIQKWFSADFISVNLLACSRHLDRGDGANRCEQKKKKQQGRGVGGEWPFEN